MIALITDVHYRMAPALIRALAKRKVRIYTCEKSGFPCLPGARSRFVSGHFTLPEENCSDALFALAERLKKQEGCKPALLPVGAATLQMLAREQSRFSEAAGLCLGAPDAIERFNDKSALLRLARRLEIPTPESYEENPPVPCVIKPVCGEKFGLRAAERYVVAQTPEEADRAVERFSALDGRPPVIQEYLPGDGLGCSVVAENGKILSHLCHRRLREYPVSGGPSSCCRAEEQPALLAWVALLIRETGFSGPAMFEFKEDAAGAPRLLECNPRIWGSFPLAEAAESTLPFAWFAAAWNSGNPQLALPLPADTFVAGRKMTFFPSDLMAAAGYLKSGRGRKAGAALGDLFNPAVRDGIFRWSDPRPALTYYAGLFRRGGSR